MSAATIDLSQVGKQTVRVTIAAIEPPPEGQKRPGWVSLEGLPNRKLKYWPNAVAKWNGVFEVGKEAEAEIEVKSEEYQGQTNMVAYLNHFGGWKGGQKGQGGKGWTPKTPEEIHADPLSRIIAACAAAGQDVQQTAEYLKLYKSAVRSIGKDGQEGGDGK